MRKKHFCKDLVLGSAVENEPYLLREIVGTSNGKMRVVLGDRTGTVLCDINEKISGNIAINDVGKVFKLSAVITVEKRQPLMIARSISLCENDYLPAEVFSGISVQKRDEYKSLIYELRKRMANDAYGSLVDSCLTDENLNRLAELPATHNLYGVYVGGALAATCSVAYMATSSMTSYVKKGNGITTSAPNWNILVCAALLHAFGQIDYCDAADPFKKSTRGVAMNYFSTLQHSIENVIYKNQLQISENEIANLLNVLAVAVSSRTDTKAVSKDGVILRHILRLYGECDAIDFQMSNYSPEEGEEYFYAPKLHRYLIPNAEVS